MSLFKLFQKLRELVLSLLEDLSPRVQAYFFTGLVIVVPTWFTLFVVANIFKHSDGFLGKWISDNLGVTVPGLGLLVTFLAITIIGLVATNYAGKKILEIMEGIMSRLPLVRNLYTGAKQVSSIVIKGNKFVFEKVAMIEYPRRGIYCLAFITGEAPGNLFPADHKRRYLSIFLPTTPNPTSGFYLIVPEEDVQVLNITPEEGIKLIISGGLVEPGNLKPV